MTRQPKRAGDVTVGDRVYFPNSRRSVTVGQVVTHDQQVDLISDDASAKWQMSVDFEISVEVEMPRSDPRHPYYDPSFVGEEPTDDD